MARGDEDWQGSRLSQAVRTQTDRYATPAFALIEEALSEAQLEREAIDCLAIGLGPGSYTGIRVAIAVAQGWELANGVRLIGISSAEALAWQAWQKGYSGRVEIVIDAQRREFYHAAYTIGAQGPETIESLRIVKQSEVERRLTAQAAVIGPGIRKAFSAAYDLYPQADRIAALAARRNQATPGEQLEPIYLRATNFVKAPPPRIVPD